MTLRLTELDRSSHDPHHHLLQQRFEEEAHSFASCDVLQEPSATGNEELYLARCTQRHGYLQLVHVSSGTFRVFLTHIDDIPMEATIRCFRFAPCLYQVPALTLSTNTLQSAIAKPVPSLAMYTISFSNQVLLADFNSADGQVLVLDEYSCRPSCLASSMSLLLVGDGRGKVHAYRGSTVLSSGGRNSLLWTASVSMHPITNLETVQQDRWVAAATQDYVIVVLDAMTGALVTSLPGELAPLAALRTLRSSPPGSPTVELVFESGLVCAFTNHDDETSKDPTAVRLSAAPCWRPAYSLRLQSVAPSTCVCAASVWREMPEDSRRLEEWLLVGTRDGRVMTFRPEVPQSRRTLSYTLVSTIDVNGPVLGIFSSRESANATVTVATATGDVWRWTLAELAATEEDEVPPASQTLDETAGVVSDPVSNGTHDVAEVSIHSAAAVDGEAASAHRATGREVVLVDGSTSTRQDFPLQVIVMMDEDTESAAGTDASGIPSSVALTATTNNTTTEQLLMHHHQRQHRGSANVKFAEVIESRAPQGNEGVTTASLRAVAARSGNDEFAAGQAPAQPSLSTLGEKQRSSSSSPPPVSRSALEISGLKEGRRMDPRRVRNIVDRAMDQARWGSPATQAAEDQSSLAVAKARDSLLTGGGQPEVSQLEVEGLLFAHRIPGLKYDASDVVYGGVGMTQPLFADADTPGSNGGAAGEPADDLMDATFIARAQQGRASRREALTLKGKQLRAPTMNHLCGSLLIPPIHATPAALFFAERAPSRLPIEALIMPLPVPPSAVAAL